jgi:hypothetical protein
MMAADAGVLGVKGDLRGRACPGRRCTIARITALACLLVGGASTTAVAVCPYSVGKDDRHCVLGISTDASTTFDDARVKLATLSGTRQHAEHNLRREAYSSDQISRPVCGGCKAGCTDDKDEVCSTACAATSEREDGTKRAGSPEGHGQHSVVESNQTMLDCHAGDACAKGGHANAAVEAPEDQQHFGADRHADRTTITDEDVRSLALIAWHALLLVSACLVATVALLWMFSHVALKSSSFYSNRRPSMSCWARGRLVVVGLMVYFESSAVGGARLLLAHPGPRINQDRVMLRCAALIWALQIGMVFAPGGFDKIEETTAAVEKTARPGVVCDILMTGGGNEESV